jgi:hypothetical protein
MASAAQIQANRLNARKSTGPRTPAGKERASGMLSSMASWRVRRSFGGKTRRNSSAIGKG